MAEVGKVKSQPTSAKFGENVRNGGLMHLAICSDPVWEGGGIPVDCTAAELLMFVIFALCLIEEVLKHSEEVGKISTDALSLAVNVPSTFKPGVPFYGTVSIALVGL